jgi:Mrp family chromosome partitioning ATPase
MSEGSSTNNEEYRLPLELRTVLKSLQLNFWWILFVFILACALGIGGALLLGTQKYESTTVLFYQPIESYVPDTFRIYQSIGEGTELTYEQSAGQQRTGSSDSSIWNKVNMVKTRPNLEALRKQLNIEKTLQQLGSSIDVYVAQDTNLMFIAAESEDKEEAQIVANTIRDIFLETINTRIAEDINEQLQLIQQQYDSTYQELAQVQKRFEDFIEEYNIRDIKTQTTIYATELARLELSIENNEQQIKIYQNRIDRVKAEVDSIEKLEIQNQEEQAQEATKMGITADEAASRIRQLSEKIDSIRAGIVDPIELEKLKNRLTIAESEYVRGIISRSEFETAYYDYQLLKAKISKPEDIQSLEAEMDAIRALPTKGEESNINSNEYLQKIKFLLMENELELIRLELQLTADKKRFETMNENYLDMPTISQTYDTLNGQIISLEAEKRGVEKILNRYKTIAENSHSEFYIISDAPIPLLPMESNKRTIAIIIAFVAFMFGFLIILARIVIDTRIKSSADAKQKLNKEIIASFPYVRNNAALLPSKEKESVQIELYRMFARPLRLQYPNRSETFLLTSSVKGEGKSTIAINLATVFGRQDERVLIMDAQIRSTGKPSPLHAYCIPESLESHPFGIGEYLSYKVATCEEIINQTIIPGVDVILRNEAAIIPDLLQSARMAELMEELKQIYSIIIIEGAPMDGCVDSEILTKYADAVLFVTSCDLLKPPLIQKNLKRLATTDIPPKGIILTKVRPIYDESFKR